jgi:hypothetical protein
MLLLLQPYYYSTNDSCLENFGNIINFLEKKKASSSSNLNISKF